MPVAKDVTPLPKSRKKIVDRILQENNPYYVVGLAPATANTESIEKRLHDVRWMKDTNPEAYKSKNKAAPALSNAAENE